MTEPKFTPGPWKKNQGTIEGAGGQQIASLYSFRYHPDIIEAGAQLKVEENEEANAHLIAAAPELYEACEDTLEAIHKWICENDEIPAVSADRFIELRQGITKLLAKARGEG